MISQTRHAATTGTALLCAVLLLPGASRASEAPAPKPRAPSWRQAKTDARRWTDELLRGVARDKSYDLDSFKSVTRKMWDLAANAERRERDFHEKRLAAVPNEKRLLRRLLNLRLLYIYGNILPRVLEESTANTPGRAYLHSKITLAIEEQPFRAEETSLRRASQAPEKLWGSPPPPGAADPAK